MLVSIGKDWPYEDDFVICYVLVLEKVFNWTDSHTPHGTSMSRRLYWHKFPFLSGMLQMSSVMRYHHE
jgi:hypothetical protein